MEKEHATMKTLYIVRHAKSFWGDPSCTDMERPLNKRGWRNAPMMGQRLADRGVHADAIWSSPALRAKETARFLASSLRFSLAEIKVNECLYFSLLDDLLMEIRSCPNTVTSLMIVGHNPTMTDMVNALTARDSGDNIESIPTCGIVALDFAVASWKKLRKDAGRRVFFDYPKNR